MLKIQVIWDMLCQRVVSRVQEVDIRLCVTSWKTRVFGVRLFHPLVRTVPSEGSTGHRATHGGLLVVIETRGKDESRHVSSGGWAVQGVRSGAAKLGTSEFVSRSVCERLTLFCFCFCAVDCAV